MRAHFIAPHAAFKALDHSTLREMLAEIKTGIGKGFQRAAEALGGTLPDISVETYNAVMDKLDALDLGASWTFAQLR